MPTKFQIAMTKAARAAASSFSTPKAVAEYARNEIVTIFGDFDLVRYFQVPGTYVSHHFHLEGKEFATYPLDPETWRLDLCVALPPESILPAYEIVLTNRAKERASLYGWSLQHVEWSARIALASVEHCDAACCEFWIPVVQQKFVAWPLDGNGDNGGRVEIDAVDEDETAESG